MIYEKENLEFTPVVGHLKIDQMLNPVCVEGLGNA